MKQFTQEQEERAIDILTRVLKNEGWQNSEVAKLLDELKPKIYIGQDICRTLYYMVNEAEITMLPIEARLFETIKEAENFIKKNEINNYPTFVLIQY